MSDWTVFAGHIRRQARALLLFDEVLDEYHDKPRAAWPPCSFCQGAVTEALYLCTVCGQRNCDACVEQYACACTPRLVIAVRFHYP